MRLYRLEVHPRASWVTPWQADTLSGMLCWALARTEGSDELVRCVLQPALEGNPPFVLSDAFPGGMLPMPSSFRTQNWPADVRKAVGGARWLRVADFGDFQRTGQLRPEMAVLEDPILTASALHNSISRSSGTVGGGGNLFAQTERALRPGFATLDVYARVDPGWEGRLLGLFHLLSRSGFGADASTGKGDFEISGGLTPASELDASEGAAAGFVVLSTFQPAKADPTDGAWETFTKYGKLGAGFGLENVFKRPTLMLKAGAVFRGESRGFVGRAIPAAELLAPETVDTLKQSGVSPVQLAFGVVVPAAVGLTDNPGGPPSDELYRRS